MSTFKTTDLDKIPTDPDYSEPIKPVDEPILPKRRGRRRSTSTMTQPEEPKGPERVRGPLTKEQRLANREATMKGLPPLYVVSRQGQ